MSISISFYIYTRQCVWNLAYVLPPCNWRFDTVVKPPVGIRCRFWTDHGYKGAAPQVGEKAEPSKRVDKVANFKGNEVRDGRGHTGGDKKEVQPARRLRH